ncbi:spore germination protein [Paenibacillus tyrfis]|uniref:spore germination protein n=1 Tax=Paenibacillus tyrfis TaxID=1501230 RepID=UPI00209DBEE4|nr:spore germination protein [Paenibacillus tyrfis]MCP1306188.1 spore germination protein [Paenibacillus tyrfis]
MSEQDLFEPLRSVLEKHGQLQTRSIPNAQGTWMLLYYGDLADAKILQTQVIPPMQEKAPGGVSLETLIRHLPVDQQEKAGDIDRVVKRLISGWTLLLSSAERGGYLLNTALKIDRSATSPEVESQITGPQVALTESLQTNISLIRQYLPDTRLRYASFQIGESTHTEVMLLYMEGVAPADEVSLMKDKLANVKFKGITDSSMLLQKIDDNPESLFPQMISSERPDRIVLNLIEGRLVILVDGSPFALLGPSRFFDFFKSAEDRYLRTNMALFLRLLRLAAIFISVFFTPLYVAALTYHYQLIPSNMLVPLAQSRSKVPFPPLMEALLLEFIIELLREAGARLPTKVGQTMGIVGGIVIGQAAVQAGFTSNILIIIVALAALSSFITPVYIMGAAIRILRFPMLLLAGAWGAVGIMTGVSFVLIHLLRVKTIGQSYLYPLYPFHIGKMRAKLPIRFRSLSQDIYEEPAGDSR